MRLGLRYSCWHAVIQVLMCNIFPSRPLFIAYFGLTLLLRVAYNIFFTYDINLLYFITWLIFQINLTPTSFIDLIENHHIMLNELEDTPKSSIDDLSIILRYDKVPFKQHTYFPHVPFLVMFSFSMHISILSWYIYNHKISFSIAT